MGQCRHDGSIDGLRKKNIIDLSSGEVNTSQVIDTFASFQGSYDVLNEYGDGLNCLKKKTTIMEGELLTI